MDSKLFNYAKSPIPVLNNSSPHNYTIMSALLSHIDSPLASSSIASSYSSNQHYPNLLISSITFHNPTIQSVYAKTSNRFYSNGNYFQNGIKQSTQSSSNRSLSSKEIIYTTKRLKLQSLNKSNQDQIIYFNNEPTPEVQEEIEEIPRDESNYNKYVMDSNQDFSSDLDTSSLINSSSVLEPNSVTNTNGFLIETDSFVNDMSQQNTLNNQSDYSTLFNESQSNNSSLVDNSSFNQVNNFTEQQAQSIESNEPVVTYTISCPSEWQFNLNRMINCFILLNKNSQTSITDSKIRLRCSVCKLCFTDLGELEEHKASSDSCKNNMNIREETEQEVQNEARKLKRKNPKKSFNLSFFNNYYADEDLDEYIEDEIKENDREYNVMDDEDEVEMFQEDNSVEEEMEMFNFDNDEDELNEENDLNDDFENSLNNEDSNENQIRNEQFAGSNDYIYYNNKILSKIKLKNNVKFKLKNTSSSSDFEREDSNSIEKESSVKSIQSKNDKPVKTRRKYTKSKANPSPSLTCEKCNKTCRTKAELLVHMHKHAGNGAECWECGKKCASFSNLVSHVQLHTGEKPYTCQFCGKQFTQDAHLTRHIRLHTGERPFVCNICGKNYKDYSYYKTHLRIHRGERLYKCNYCNKEYYDASYYKKHTRLHTGEKPYMCTVCGRQFHRSDYLKLHSYSHTDERPFNCHICGKGFKMNYNLKIHLKNHENQENINQSSVINSSNDETSSFNESNHFTSSGTGLESLGDAYHQNQGQITSIVNANDFNTNEIVSYFIQDIDIDRTKLPLKLTSNSIGLDPNTIQIINNSASHHHGLNDLDVSILDEHQISIVN